MITASRPFFARSIPRSPSREKTLSAASATPTAYRLQTSSSSVKNTKSRWSPMAFTATSSTSTNPTARIIRRSSTSPMEIIFTPSRAYFMTSTSRRPTLINSFINSFPAKTCKSSSTNSSTSIGATRATLKSIQSAKLFAVSSTAIRYTFTIHNTTTVVIFSSRTASKTYSRQTSHSRLCGVILQSIIKATTTAVSSPSTTSSLRYTTSRPSRVEKLSLSIITNSIPTHLLR